MTDSLLIPKITLELEMILLSLLLLITIMLVVIPMTLIWRKERKVHRRSLNASFRYVDVLPHSRDTHLPVCVDGRPRSRQPITYLHAPSPRPVPAGHINTAYADEFINHLSQIWFFYCFINKSLFPNSRTNSLFWPFQEVYIYHIWCFGFYLILRIDTAHKD